MFMNLESFVNIDDELSALLADYAAFIGDDAGLPAEIAAAVFVDPATETTMVIDPMLPDDGAVFGDAPTVVDAGVSADPADTAPDMTVPDATAPAEVSIVIEADAVLQIDAADFGLDLDSSILFVGRGFSSHSFTDLP